VAVREGNHIVTIDACDQPPMVIRQLVDLLQPGLYVTVSRNGKKYTVPKPRFISAIIDPSVCLSVRP